MPAYSCSYRKKANKYTVNPAIVLSNIICNSHLYRHEFIPWCFLNPPQ